MIDNERIRALLRSEHDHAISIFLPTPVAGREVRQDPIRFRKLVDEAAERLQHAGMRKSAAEEVLAPAYEPAKDEVFWRHQPHEQRGLAAFAAPGFFQRVQTPIELPEGRFDKAQDQVVAHGSATEDDEDLLDYAAGQTILQGGRVELLPKEQLPRHGLMAAILRY